MREKKKNAGTKRRFLYFSSYLSWSHSNLHNYLPFRSDGKHTLHNNAMYQHSRWIVSTSIYYDNRRLRHITKVFIGATHLHQGQDVGGAMGSFGGALDSRRCAFEVKRVAHIHTLAVLFGCHTHLRSLFVGLSLTWGCYFTQTFAVSLDYSDMTIISLPPIQAYWIAPPLPKHDFHILVWWRKLMKFLRRSIRLLGYSLTLCRLFSPRLI